HVVDDAHDKVRFRHRLDLDLGRWRAGVGGNSVRRHCHERTRTVQASLFEQAPAPALAHDGGGIAGLCVDAVGRKRQSHARCQPRHDLVATFGARGDHGRCVHVVRGPGEDRRQRIRGEGPHRVHRDGLWFAELACKGECLLRSIARVHQDDDSHKTPAFCSISTTAGAAAEPAPSDSARRPWPAGTASFTGSRRGSGRVGMLSAMGLLRARILPGTEGYRGRFRPSFTVSTAGSGTTYTSPPPSTSCSQRTEEPSSVTFLSPATHGRASAYVTRLPTWKPAESPD